MLPCTADSCARAIADDLPPIPEGFQLEPPTGRADMAAEPDPSITGPRVPDTIDVGAGRPTPLLDPISEQRLLGNAERVQPGEDRKSVGAGKSVAVRVDLGGRRNSKKKKTE